jgi:hypothetical protein
MDTKGEAVNQIHTGSISSIDSLCLCFRGMAGTGKRTQLLSRLKQIAESRGVSFNIQMKTLSFDSNNASTVNKSEQDDDDSKQDTHTIEYESSLVHIGFDISRMSMQDKNILRPVLTNFGKGSHVLGGEHGRGNRIIVLYHSHLLSSESILIIQSVLEQNDGDLSLWFTSELPVTHRIRDWFVEIPVGGKDYNFDKFKKLKANTVNWNYIFYEKIKSWINADLPNLKEVADIKAFIYEILMRNLRWVECTHFLLDVILDMKELNEKQRTLLLKVLSNTQATGGGLTLPSYRIPIVWENLFINLRNAIIDGSL